MGLFVRNSVAPNDKNGQISYFVDDDNFVRRASAPADKYGSIVYYLDDNGFVRRSSSPSDKYGAIVYYVDANGFVRKSTSPSDKNGAIVYCVDEFGFVRKSSSASDIFGTVVYYLDKEKKEAKKKENTQRPVDEKKGALLAVACAIALVLAPVVIVLGMFGKFLLGGLFENVLEIETFKKFRRKYSIVNFVWLGLGIAAIAVFSIFQLNAGIPLFALVGGNIVLFVLSIVFGNKIYKEHKDEISQRRKGILIDETAEENAENEQVVKNTKSVDERQSDNLAAIPTHLRERYDRLKGLLEAGIITQAEFDENKRALLEGASTTATASTSTSASVTTDLNKNNKKHMLPLIIAVIAGIIGAISTFNIYYYYDFYNLLFVIYLARAKTLGFLVGVVLLIAFFINLKCKKRRLSIGVSVATLLFSAISEGVVFFAYISGFDMLNSNISKFNFAMLVVMLGISILCQTISLILLYIGDAKRGSELRKERSNVTYLWVALGFTIFSYLINLNISLDVGGTLYWMFKYIFAGYIIGFFFMGVGVVRYFISFNWLSKQNKAKISRAITLILMIALLCFVFSPLVFHY